MRIGVGLSIPELATRGGRFSPASLFTSGVAGAWYDPSDVLLNWRTNLLTYTQEFDNAAWTPDTLLAFGSGSVANATTAPDGTTTADKIVLSAVSGQQRIYSSANPATVGTYTYSVYAKPAGYNFVGITIFDGVSYKGGVVFNVSTGEILSSPTPVGTATIVAAGNGWYRVSVSCTTAGSMVNSFTGIRAFSSAPAAINGASTGNGTDGVFIWGAQLELGSTATTYQAITTPEQTYLLYDPQPVLYQDSAGTTPVTAVEQPVGLMLDKSQGLVLGSEILTNGGFATDTDWTKGAGVTISGGTMNFSAATSNTFQREATEDNSGKVYEYTIVVSSVSGGNLVVGLNSSPPGSADFPAITSAGTYTYRRRYTGTTAYFYLVATGFTGSIDSVSCKAVAGNHASQATAASRPVLRARYNLLTYSEQFDNAVWSKPNQTVEANTSETVDPLGGSTADKTYGTGAGSNWVRQDSAVSGTLVTVSVYLKAGTATTAYIGDVNLGSLATFNLSAVTSTNTGGSNSFITSMGNGWYRCGVTYLAVAGFSRWVFAAGTTYNANTTTTLYCWGADLRTGFSAGTYQRIAAATDYATAGFLPYLAFDGVDDILIATPASADYILNSVAFGAQYNAFSGNATLGSIGNSATGNSFSYIAENSASSLFNASARNDAATTVSTYIGTPDLLPHVLISIWNASASSVQNNSSIVTGSALTGVITANKFALGALGRSTNTAFSNSRIYSALFISPALTTAQSTSLASYIAAKSGVTL